jgi:predicted metal-binding membrane protein
VINHSAHNPLERADGTFLAISALLFIASAGATIYWAQTMSGGMTMPGGWTMSMMWMRMPGQTWVGATASFVGMWVTMMVAMMLPSLVPMLSSYRHTVRVIDARRVGVLTALAGGAYFSVWAFFGVVVYTLGVQLAAAAMRWPALARSIPVTIGIVLLVAGWVQLSAWKARQLGHCRDAASCRQSDSSDAWSAWQDGLRLGMYCSLCCATFMTILLVTGVMHLGVMMVLAGALTLERLTPRPERVARLAGFVMFAAGALVIARALQPML